MDWLGVDPLVWAAAVALIGYGLNGWAQKRLDQRRILFEKKVESYSRYVEALNGVSDQLFALRSLRSISWRFETDADINEAGMMNRRILRRAEMHEQSIGGSSLKPLREAHDALVEGRNPKMSKAEVARAIKLSVADLDDLHLNWLGHYVNQCMAEEGKITLFTSDQRVFRHGTAMSRFMKAEQEWILDKDALAANATISDTEKAAHSDQFYDRANALIAALREDLARNRLPRRIGRNWATVEANLGIPPPLKQSRLRRK